IRGQGKPQEMINGYMQDLQIRREDMHSKGRMLQAEMTRERSGSREVTIEQVRFFDKDNSEKYLFNAGDPMELRITYDAKKEILSHSLYIAIHTFDGRMIIGPLLRPYEAPISGKGQIKATINGLPLLKGEYFMSVGIFQDDWVNAYDFHDKYYRFTVTQPGDWGIKGEIYAPCDIEYLNG
ncbi:MAG TPA: hypothetical protein ENN67_02165, partial [Firmicutes bacterium]|nr:hypothetical protein [Bacillota bacterium]